MFDQAKLAVVAYGEVSGDTGSSTRCNSIGDNTTTRLGLGTYQITLPQASQNQIGLTQFSDRDLIFIQPLNADFPVAATAVNDQVVGSDGKADSIKKVFLGSSATTAVNCSFSFLILRTLTPPTTGGPA